MLLPVKTKSKASESHTKTCIVCPRAVLRPNHEGEPAKRDRLEIGPSGRLLISLAEKTWEKAFKITVLIFKTGLRPQVTIVANVIRARAARETRISSHHFRSLVPLHPRNTYHYAHILQYDWSAPGAQRAVSIKSNRRFRIKT